MADLLGPFAVDDYAAAVAAVVDVAGCDGGGGGGGAAAVAAVVAVAGCGGDAAAAAPLTLAESHRQLQVEVCACMRHGLLTGTKKHK